MRSVLEEKLKLDGVVWDEFILKDNVGNLMRGTCSYPEGEGLVVRLRRASGLQRRQVVRLA